MSDSDTELKNLLSTKETQDTKVDPNLSNRLISYIVDLAHKIQTIIDRKNEPIDQLKELNQILNNHAFSIWGIIGNQDHSKKLDFYKQVFKTTADKLLAEKSLQQPGYLPQILRFFRNILVNFFPNDISEEALAEIVHSLFNLDAALYTTALQSNHRKQMNQQQDSTQHLEEDEMSLEQRRLRDELQWRNDLKAGDQVDCISLKTVQNTRIQHWAKGVVSHFFEPDQLYVSFDNEDSNQNKMTSRMSPEIAYPGTFTDDFDWRYELKPGDLIDCLDSECVWYRSTCLGMRTNELNDGKQQKEIFVGYRIYDEEEGHKQDDDGRKYLGWSNRYDDWTSLTSPIVQRYKTMIKHYKIAGKATMIYENVVDDLVDVIYNTKERKIWATYRNNFFSNLKCIPDYLNEFGMRGGYDKILNFLSNSPGKQKITMRHLYHIMDFLGKTQPLWHRQFACDFIPMLRNSFEKAFLYTDSAMTGPTQQKFNKESLSGIQRSFQNILRRYYTNENYQIIMAELFFNVGFSLLKSEKLEQRILGLKEIVEQIKGNRFSARKSLNNKDILRKLKDENIFDIIFGENYHIQLIQRSQEIIKFYIAEKEIGQKEIEQIWQATKRDQQTKMEIYKIISDIAISFKNEDIELLVTKFAQVEPEQFVEKEIECVYELSKYSYKQASFSITAANLFWDIAVQERPYKKQIIEMAMEKFIDLTRNWDREQKGEYVYKCIEKVIEHKSTVQCIKIMQKLLEQIPNYRVNNNPTLYESATQLIKDCDLINKIIEDLDVYEKKANTLWGQGIINPENIETVEVFDLPFSHRSQTHIRLNFIKNLLQYSQSQLEPQQLDIIWDILMVQTKITIDSDIFFNWFRQLITEQNKLSLDLIQSFFQTKVCNKDVSFKTIRKAGFDCICNIFLQINEQEDKIAVLSLPTQNNQNTKLDFRVHVPPNELTGIEVIWKLLQECDKKNLDLTSVVIDLITKCYHNLSSALEHRVHEVEDQFCHEALQKLQTVIEDQSINEEEKKSFIHSMTLMIKSFFEDSEKNGTGGMRIHQALDRGLYIENIVIQNNITSQKNSPKYIVINAYSNMTIWELKKLVAEKTKQSPLRIQISRSDQKKKQITDQDNQKMLREFRIENYEQLSAHKKPLLYQPRVPLITKKRELVPQARVIFEEIFNKFSNDGIMTPENCVDFIRNATSDQTVMITDQRIVRLFNEYDKDIDGKLSKEEFLEFYRDRALQKPELVWSNLNSYGYGNDLRPVANQYSQDDPQELKDFNLLPRCKLSQLNILDGLFNLTKQLSGPAQDDMWAFITQLRTNSYTYAKLLALNDLDEFTNSNNTVHKLLYNLQILEYLINEYSVKKPCEVRLYFNENQEYNQQYPALNEQQNSDNIQASAAPESGKAIPLPPAPSNYAHTGHNNNIPEPPTQVPFIGPALPNGNQQSDQSKIKEVLDNFKGYVITEQLKDHIFDDEELHQLIGDLDVQNLKANWIQNFVVIGGFNILMTLMENLYKYSVGKGESEILKSKVEKECLNQIMKIMKILLLSSFIANSPNQELSAELTRKMSASEEQYKGSTDDQNNMAQMLATDEAQAIKKAVDIIATTLVGASSDKDQKSNLQNFQDDAAKQYEPLIQQFVGEIGHQILASIEFQSFQDQLLSIIQLILMKKDKITSDDKNIINQGISIWISCIVFNSELLKYIYDDQKKGDIEKGKSKSIVHILIEDGLLCVQYLVRTIFKDAITFICLRVKSQNLSEQPYIFFLRMLLSEIKLVDYRSKESKQYFQLLKQLLSMYFDAQKNNQEGFKKIFDHKQLLQEFISTLVAYESRERKTSYLEDTNLVGYLEIIHELIKNNSEILSINEYKNLITEVVEKCLFTFHIDPLNTDITNEVDLVAYEKPLIHKCLTNEARTSAYQLLQTICSIHPYFVSDLISNYWHPLIFKVRKPKKPGFNPKSEGKSFYGYCGMKNLGAICYMNSMIQQFFHIPSFRYSLLAVNDNQPPNLQNFDGEQVDDNALHQLMRLMGFLELSERQDYNPREFCFSFKDFAGQPTNVRIQQDSQEFLNLAFDRLEHLLANTSQKYLLQNVFGGKTCSMMICKSCGNLRQRHEDFYNLSLEVKNQKSIYDGLKKFVSGEIINDFQCEACNQRVDVERKTVLDKLPNVLIVHLQRIIFDYDSLMNLKLNSRVEFPNVLNMKPYMFTEVMKNEKELLKKARKEKRKQEKANQHQNEFTAQEAKVEDGKQEEEDDRMQIDQTTKVIEENNEQLDESSTDEEEENEEMKEEEPEENFQYKLVGVIVHMGTADAGHYISYINIGRNSKPENTPEWLLTDKEKWLEFNDSTVKDYRQKFQNINIHRFSNLEEDCFGGVQAGASSSGDFKNDYSRNAYMLIYEKRYKTPLKVVIPNEIIVQQQSSQSLTTLDCEGTAISRDLLESNNHQLIKVCPQILQSEVQHDEEKQEYYVNVDFNSVQKFVPNSIYKLVHEDNHLFMSEKQVFNNSFADVTKNLVDLLVKKAPEIVSEQNPSNKEIFEIIDRLIFDLLTMSSENKHLLDLAKLMITMLDQNYDKTLKFIQDRILTAKELLDKDQKTFFEALISHLEKEVREINSIFLIFAVNKLFEAKNTELIDTIMNQAFALIPEDLAKNWLKIHHFLYFLFEVTKKGIDQMEYMINKKLISKLVDFFLENASPLATGKKRQTMGSNYANPPLELLILIISFIARHQPYINMNLNQQDQLIDIEQRQSPYFMNLFQHRFPPLSHEDIYMLSQKEFIAKGMRQGYEAVEFGRLMAHLSFDNYDYSHKVSKRVLVGINKSNSDEIEPYLHVLTQILIVPDAIMDQRFEWILGIPYLKIEKPAVYQSQQNQTQPKLGISLIDAANDDIVEYKSTLFKTSTAVKESFLQVLYQYRKRWSKYSLACLHSLLEACKQDRTLKLVNYLRNMDPPTYVHARYIDWIQPYLIDQIDTCLRNINIQSYKQEYMMAVSINTTFEQVLKPLQDENQEPQNQDGNQQPRIFQYNSQLDGGPEQYIMWNIIEERIFAQQTLFDDKIEIRVRELNVKISESRPDGITNHAFPNDLFQKSFKIYQNVGMNNQNVSSGNWGGRRQYGRGQSQYIPKNQTSGRKNKGVKHQWQKKKRVYTVHESNNQQDSDAVHGDAGNPYRGDDCNNGNEDSMEVEYEDYNENQDHDPEVQGTPVQDIQGNMQEGGNYDEDRNRDQDINQNDNQQMGSVPMPQGSNNQEMQEPQQDQEEWRNGFNANQPTDQNNNQEYNPYQQANPDQQADNVQESNLDSWEAHAWTVLVFQVINHDQTKAQKVVFSFRDNSEEGQTINFKIPKSRIPYQIMGGRDNDALVFTKLRPFEDWGQFEFFAEVEHKNNNSNNVPNIVGPSLNAQDSQGGYPKDDPGMTIYDDEKECGFCTLINPSINITCDVCGNPLK